MRSRLSWTRKTLRGSLAHEGRLGTSFHVIGEMYGFLRKAEDGLPTNARADLKRRFWQLVRSTFRNLRMTERAVAVVDMLEEILVQLGPVDAGLLELAKEPVERGGPVVVLTADTRLFQLCGQHGVRAEYVPDRLEEFRQMR